MTTTVSALWKREIIKFVRDRSRLFGALVQPLGFWLLLGLGFRGTFRMPVETGADIGYMEFLFPGIITLILLFTAIFSTISIVEERRSGFLQAALVAPASRTALVLGSTLGGTTLALGEALLFLLLLPLVGLWPGVGGLALVLVVGFLTAFSFTALGVIIAWRMETTRGFHAVMNLFLLPLWFLSGGFFPAEGAPVVLQWVMRFNPVSYAVAALRQALYWPADPPLVFASLGLSLAITFLFAAILLIIAVRVVQKPILS